jgi:hypothetical protein
MTTVTAVPHTVHRLVIDLDVPFDEFRARFEAAVPRYDVGAAAARLSDWDAVVADADKAAPYGFLIYTAIETWPIMALAGLTARSVVYLMGMHTIAETMYRHDPGVMLYAPLRAVLYEDYTGKAHYAIDQPSDEFASFGEPDIAATGRLLDEKLAALFRTLGMAIALPTWHEPPR